ncbi:MAG TPA: PKD domain-containing protein, partial [Chloroflexia bacterium]
MWLLVLALRPAESGLAAAPATKQVAAAKSKSGAIPARPMSPGTPRYDVFTPPDGLGTNAGEPSIGVNHNTGAVMYIANVQTLRVTFTDCVSPAQDLWEDVSVPYHAATVDPILFTDPVTGRTFSSQLVVRDSLMAFSDDDGDTWNTSEGGSALLSAVDHQSVASGPWAEAATITSTDTYTHAVYYCSQDVADASCAVSHDGGFTFAPPVPMYTAAQCGGLHGHIRVAADGTAYVPNRRCGIAVGVNAYNTQGLLRSTDSGTTWTLHHVDDPMNPVVIKAGLVDPQIGIGSGGRVYMGMQNRVTQGGVDSWPPYVAVSDDKGETWDHIQRIGEDLGIQNSVFPVMVAGDDDRAAFAFIGTTTPGNYQANTDPVFTGVWHLYISTTFDGGVTWTTVDATPNDPVQRGSICTNGTTCTSSPNDRNLLDFNDATVDEEGRTLIAFADGCVGPCVQGTTNSYSALASIARQSGGKRLYAAFDPADPDVPGAPNVTAIKGLGGVSLTWGTPDDGGSPITEYRIYRGTSPDNLTLLATVTDKSYIDSTANTPGETYYYRVTAVNAVGESQACEPVVPVIGENPCEEPGVTVLNDPVGDERAVTPDQDIRTIFAAEPYFPNGEKMVFTMRTGGLETLSPSTRWQVYISSTQFSTMYFVGMQTDAAGTVSYKYGTATIDSNGLLGTSTVGDLDPESSYDPSGDIRLVASKSKIGNPQPGQLLAPIFARINGPAVNNDNANWPSSSPSIDYAVVGNQACATNRAPVAIINASQLSGVAPLDVTLDGALSNDPDGDAITSYTFNFGDGSLPVTQAGSSVEHTYANPGSYHAQLTVTDARGKVSENTAQVLIQVVSEGGNPGCDMDFPDVQPGDTFYPYVHCMVCQAIVGGFADGMFHPDYNVSRGQLAKMVSNSVGYMDVVSGQTYADVPPTHTFYAYIERLSRHSVIGGYPCGG